MKAIKKILLTGDDGYNATGLRLVIAALKDKYDLTIAATFDQQSGVGGRLSLHDGFDWGQSEVDGVRAFWVKGSPADAMELMACYFKDYSFDLVVSGVNWGANLGASTFGSGTLNATLRSLGAAVTKKALALSWDLPTDYYLQDHHGKEDLNDFLDYPGKAIDQVLDLVLDNKFFGADLLNINFPTNLSSEVRVSRLMPHIKQVFVYQDKSNQKLSQSLGGHFSYKGQSGGRNHDFKEDLRFDVAAINSGYISITPCKFDILNEKIYQQIKNKKFKL